MLNILVLLQAILILVLLEYQPRGAKGTRSPSAFGHSRQLSKNKFSDQSTPSLRKVDNEKETEKIVGNKSDLNNEDDQQNQDYLKNNNDHKVMKMVNTSKLRHFEKRRQPQKEK